MEIKRLEEFKLSKSQHKQIRVLLEESFSNYPKGQTYYQQIPDFRYLAIDKKQVIGQMSVDHRMMEVDGQKAKVFGISDFCISHEMQHKKIATKMLQAVEALAIKHKIDFLVLTATDNSLYKKNGFKAKNNIAKWLAILQGQTLGVHYKRLKNTIMVKELSDLSWGRGDIDFMGHMF